MENYQPQQWCHQAGITLKTGTTPFGLTIKLQCAVSKSKWKRHSNEMSCSFQFLNFMMRTII